jgi:Cd2+/Zn2+-exporting ATPase
MSLAVTGALALRLWPEAAMVMVLFAVAEFIEAKSLDRARRAIEHLMQVAPETVTVQLDDGTWAGKAARDVALGAQARVKPGERIGLDGIITSGRSVVNQAPITGESLPVEKTQGDAVYAGTINGAGTLEYRVTAAAGQTLLARIIHAVHEAQGARAPTQRFVDRFARIYTPIVCLIAVAVALVPPLAFHALWFDWIYKALVMLVIACPCALVISTPVAIVSGLAAAARHGILIKGGVYLEEGRKLAWLALDKTGTITQGRPVQTDVQPCGALDLAQCRAVAASLAACSDHPVSQAIAASYLALPGAPDGAPAHAGLAASSEALRPVEEFEAVFGRGVKGLVDGHAYALGNYRYATELGLGNAELAERVGQLERQGQTVVLLMDADRAQALFTVADTVKPSSRAAIAELHRVGVRTVMLSGDNTPTAEAIARQVGIDQAYGGQLPEDKLRAIERYAGCGVVGMVGDGINDAPALARADIGFAMGVIGSDTAIETADVALMDDDLNKIPVFVRLSRATHRVLVQNIAFALGIKAVFLGLAVLGAASMWMAVFADVGASLLVVANSLRLLRK